MILILPYSKSVPSFVNQIDILKVRQKMYGELPLKREWIKQKKSKAGEGNLVIFIYLRICYEQVSEKPLDNKYEVIQRKTLQLE